MKKIIFALALVVMAATSCSVPQTQVMDKIRQIDNIQSVRLPVSLINSMTGLGDKAQSIPGLNLSALKNVTSIDIMTITENGAKNKARGLLRQFYKGSTYDLIMQSKQNVDQGLSLYALPNGYGQYSDAILISDTNSTISIVELRGTMTAEDLKLVDL